MSERIPHQADGPDLSLEEILVAVRYRMITLTRAICTYNYLGAWSESCELTRLLARAVEHAAAIVEPEPHEAAEREIDKIYPAATRLLDLAPTPSDAALLQVRSTDWQADRSIWDREEQLWIDARKRGDAPQPVTASRARRDTRPESPQGLHSPANTRRTSGPVSGDDQ